MKPKTIFGCTFSPQNALILSAVQRCRGYQSNIWISSFVSERLRLNRFAPYNSFHFPVKLCASNAECLFDNIEEFAEDEREIVRRLKKVFPGTFLLFNSSRNKPSKNSTVQKNSSLQISTNNGIPLDTNGEPFDKKTESRIIAQYQELMKESPYWVTESEAKFVFQVDLKEKSKHFGAQFQVRRFGGHLLNYYHVSETTNPQVFNSKTCLRYDPYNFFGMYYRPVTALAMKRYAIQNNCCLWSRWVCVQRAQLYNVDLLPHVTPLSLVLSHEVVQLVNVGLTTNPSILENVAVKKQHFLSIEDEALQRK